MANAPERWDRGTLLLIAHVLVIVGVLAYLVNR